MPQVAYVTYRLEPGRPDPDIDIPLALPAMAARGVTAEVVCWDDGDVDWASYELVLLRSAWDYVPRFAEFMTWARRISALTRLLPPLEVIERNTDKRYLRDLHRAGIPIVPTHWLEPGSEASGSALVRLGWSRVVVKPAISSGSRDTIVTTDMAEAAEHAAQILAGGRPVLVQPYLDAVDHAGEVSVVVIDGTPSHAIRKVPTLTVGGYGDASEAVELAPDLLAAVERVLAAEPLAEGLPFVRVDVVHDGTDWLVMELELTEPLLFLGYAGGAAERFAAAVVAALG